MKFTATQIGELSSSTKFPSDNLEKVLRLRDLLIEFHKHSFLRGKLVLKGGTALNLFYLNLARLSVDIDLNYIGQIDREATLRDRPEIVKAIEQVTTGLGYRLQNGKDDYALREWYLNFTNHANRPDRMQVEVNFLMRACALPAQLLNAERPHTGALDGAGGQSLSPATKGICFSCPSASRRRKSQDRLVRLAWVPSWHRVELV